jgi:hypothetical protein
MTEITELIDANDLTEPTRQRLLEQWGEGRRAGLGTRVRFFGTTRITVFHLEPPFPPFLTFDGVNVFGNRASQATVEYRPVLVLLERFCFAVKYDHVEIQNLDVRIVAPDVILASRQAGNGPGKSGRGAAEPEFGHECSSIGKCQREPETTLRLPARDTIRCWMVSRSDNRQFFIICAKWVQTQNRAPTAMPRRLAMPPVQTGFLV